MISILLVTALVSGGLAAFLTKTDSPGHKSAREAKKRSPESAHANRQAPVGTEEEPEDIGALVPPPLAQPSEGEWDEFEVPDPEDALAYRKDKQTARQDVVDRGIDALIDPPDCEEIATLVETARSGEGMLGCLIEVVDAEPFVMGTAATRRADGIIEVGDYQEGRRSGEWEHYYPNGYRSAVGSYVDGQQDGEWHSYDRHGRHRSTHSYQGGRLHGLSLRFSQDRAQVALYFEGVEYDPQTREPLHQGKIAEVQ